MLGSGAGGKKPIKEAEKLRAQKPKLERVSHYITKDKKAGAVLQGIGVGVEQARRKTGIDILGDIAWGTHFCVFYQSKQDLIDILAPYFKEGLENNEFCMWITSEPLNAKEAKKSLKQAVNNIDSYIKKGQIEILDYGEWYTKSGKFEADRVLQGWIQKYDDAITRGFDGLRLTGNTFWLEKKGWSEFIDYEESVNNIIGKYKMLAICTYSLDKCGASEVIDVVNNHQFAIVKREELWDILESAERKKAQKEARDAQRKLIEQYRHEREHAEADLAKVRDELIRTTRLATIGQVSASIAHDLRNPLGAMRNASYFLRRHLSKNDLKAPEHLEIIEQEVVKADQIITNLLEMARPKTPHKQEIDLGEIVKNVFSRAKRAEGVRCQPSLVPDPFVVRADPSQLRQMIGNIVDNAVDAMKGQGEIFVEATRDSDYDTLVFRDTGPGFAQEVIERLFEPLVTTKASGTGLGLMICHQIVEKHGGTIGAENCEGRGAAIRVRLPR